MKIKHRILSCLTLLAVVWSIVFSGTIFFQQQQAVNLKKLAHTSSITNNNNNSVDNSLSLINLLSNKTEENTEVTDFENEENENNSFFITLNSFHFSFKTYNCFLPHALFNLFFTPKCSIIVKYCKLKLPF